MKNKSLLFKLFIAVILLSAQTGKAQLIGADVFIKGDYVEIGVGTGGWYGTGASAPTGYHPRTPGPTLGFVSDPDKDGWTAGIPNYCGDYFVPGFPQEGWDIQVGSSWAKAWLSSGLTGGITGSNVSYTSTATDFKAVWEGAYSGLAIRQTTILKKDKLYFLIKITLKNTTSSDINDIYYDRTLDPDNASTMGGLTGVVTSSGAVTKNTIEFKLPNPKSKSLVSAIASLTVQKSLGGGLLDTVDYPVYLGIGSKDCRANPYILSSGLNPGTADSPSRLYRNDNTMTHLFDSGETNTTDAATGLIFNVAKLKPGDSTSFFMAYVLSTADLDSAFKDMAPTFIYDGIEYQSGDTVKMCREATAPDERKNLDIFGGEDYSWTWVSKPGLENLTGTDNSILLTNTPVTYIVKPSEAFGCLDSMVITIMPYINPTIPSVVSPVTYCRFGSAVPLKATGMTGATVNYYYTAVGGTPVASITPNTSGPGTFTFYASQKNGICESARTPITVIVNPIPNLDSFTTFDPTTCGGMDGWIRFKADLKDETYTVYYDKNGSAQPVLTLTSDANGFITIPGLGKGSYTAIYIVNKFGCISNTYYGPVLLKGPVAVPPVVSNNGPLCAGDLAKLMTLLKDSTSYLWTGPAGYSSTSANPSFTSKNNSGGVYTLVTDKNGCISDPVTTTLVVNLAPENPELPDQALCEGGNLIAEVFGESNANYTWTGGADGFVGVEATLKRQNVQLNYAGTYILNAINDFGCKMSDTIVVVIDPRVTLSHSKDTSICHKDSISLFVTTNTSSVIWSPSKGMNDSSSKNPRVSPDSTTVYTVRARTDHNTCPDTSGLVKVTVIPTPKVVGYDTSVRMNIPYTILPTYGQDVIKWRWTPADSLSCSDCPNPVFNSNRQMVYKVEGINKEGCVGSDLLTIKVFCDGANVTMPNAFTPNGDGNNDIFYVRGTGFTVKSFSVYNRFGELVFSKENFKPNDPAYGWDGTFGGQAVSDAAGFVYMMEIVCYNSSNAPELIKGTVLMIK
ncbi:MAG: gliding motility-associated C-terminal domain-containing protein [Bacteroidota bacterium]